MNQSPLRPNSSGYVMQPPRVVSSTTTTSYGPATYGTTTYGPNTTTYPVTTYQSSPYVIRSAGGPTTTYATGHAPTLNVVSPDGVVVGAYRGAPAGAAADNINSRPRRVVIKKQKAGCCGGCNRNGCCDKGAGCGCWNCAGCCDRAKTTYRRMGSATSVVEIHQNNNQNNRRRC